MILLGFIISWHPDWKRFRIKIFEICKSSKIEEVKKTIEEFVISGRLPITIQNFEIIPEEDNISAKSIINERSKTAELTILGFRKERLKNEGEKIFQGYEALGSVLFVNSHKELEID